MARRSLRTPLALLSLLAAAGSLRAAETVKLWDGANALAPYDATQGVFLLTRSKVYRAPTSIYAGLSLSQRAGLLIVLDTIGLPGIEFDTYHELPAIPPDLAESGTAAKQLYLIQFLDWRWDTGLPVADWVWSHDSRVPVASSAAAVVWADATDRERLESLVWSEELHDQLDYGDDPPDLLQYAGPYHPYFKLDRTLRGSAPTATVQVDVSIFRHPDVGATETLLQGLALGTPEISNELHRKLYRMRVRGSDLARVAAASDVIEVRPASQTGLAPDKAFFHVWARSGWLDLEAPGLGLLYDSGQSQLVRIADASLDALDPLTRSGLHEVSDLLPAPTGEWFDTQDGSIPLELQAPPDQNGKRLHVLST